MPFFLKKVYFLAYIKRLFGALYFDFLGCVHPPSPLLEHKPEALPPKGFDFTAVRTPVIFGVFLFFRTVGTDRKLRRVGCSFQALLPLSFEFFTSLTQIGNLKLQSLPAACTVQEPRNVSLQSLAVESGRRLQWKHLHAAVSKVKNLDFYRPSISVLLRAAKRSLEYS